MAFSHAIDAFSKERIQYMWGAFGAHIGPRAQRAPSALSSLHTNADPAGAFGAPAHPACLSRRAFGALQM